MKRGRKPMQESWNESGATPRSCALEDSRNYSDSIKSGRARV